MPHEIITRAEAKAAGLKHFYTGLPCKNGHVEKRATHNSVCMGCLKIASAKTQKKNRAIINEKRRLQYANDEAYRHKVLETSRLVRERNEYSRDANKRWAQRNPDQVRSAQRAYRDANREKVNEARRKWYAANRDLALSINRTNRAKRVTAEGFHTAADIQRIYEAQKGKCACCNKKLNGKYHVDHIQPLARGGSNWPDNLQALCQPCNNRKSSKDPIKFAQENGRLL